MHCPSCGAGIPNVVAAAPFCPYCGTKKPVELLADDEASRREAKIAALQKAQREARPAKPKKDVPFSSRRDAQILVFDPRAGYALLGLHAPDGEPPRLRAWDVSNGRVAWEAMAGERGIADLDWKRLAVHSGNVYVGGERSVRVLDLFTGAEKWRSELSDALAHESHTALARGPRIYDPAQAGTRGTVWVVAVDDVICAFDRDSGQLQWRETRERLPHRFHPFESGLLLLESSHLVELVDPATKRVVDHISGRIERVDLEGHVGLVQVEDWGWRERDGILVHDFVAKKELLFEAVEDLEDDVPTVAFQGKVFAAVESGAKLHGGPKGKTVELVPAFHVKWLTMCGPTLMVLLEKHHGTRLRRVVGVDPQTLAVRFDLGELPPSPSGDWQHMMCSNGQITVVAVGDAGESRKADLVALDPTGRVVWKRPVHGWTAHHFLGGQLAVFSSAGWQVVRVDTGEALGV